MQWAHACRMGPFCLHRATEIEDRRSDRRVVDGWQLEVEDDTCGDAQVVLSLRTRAEFVEARQEIIDLRGTNGKAAGYLHIDAATDGWRM